MTSSVGEVELAELRGTLSGTMAKNMNHDIFKVLAQSFAFYNRLANTERSLEVERKMREEALTELEKAKDIAAVAEAEKQEILQHKLKTIEENKALKTDRARLDREVKRKKARVSQLEAEVSRLRGEVENAGSATIADFKNTDDFQAILMLVFLEGFEHAKAKFSASFPELDISQIAPGSSNSANLEEQEAEGVEEDVPAKVIAEIIADVTAEILLKQQLLLMTTAASRTLTEDCLPVLPPYFCPLCLWSSFLFF